MPPGAGFRYNPGPGTRRAVGHTHHYPAFDRLAEPYRSLALLMYDLQLVSSLRWQDQRAADDYSTAHPLDPPGWYPLATVHQILENDRQRLAQVRQHMSGVAPKTRNALICLINSSMNRVLIDAVLAGDRIRRIMKDGVE